MLLVDNAVYSFGAQLENGIPMTPFKENPDDKEFLYLKLYLQKLMEEDDLPKANERNFRLKEISSYNLDNFIDYYDYEECE